MARSKGEGSIYYIEKRKKWSAQYTITVGDKQVRKTVYGNTKREVADKLLDLRVQMKDIDLIKEHGMSIIQIMKDIRDKKFNSNRIKEGQYTRITKTIEKIENSSLGKLNVKDISNDDIQKFLNDNKNYSNSYIKKLYEQLNQAFNFAIKNKYILQNPMDDVIKPKSTKEDKEVRALTIEEQQSLSNYLLNCTINEETYKNVFLYSDGTEKNSFYTAAYFADCNVLVHNCKELRISSNIYIPGEYVISSNNPNRKSAKYYSDIACYLKQKRAEYLSNYLKHLP